MSQRRKHRKKQNDLNFDGDNASSMSPSILHPSGPCQISFTKEDAGKVGSCVTRMVRWRFSLPKSLSLDLEEHMVRLLWYVSPSGRAHVTLSSSKGVSPPCSLEFDSSRTVRRDSVVEFEWESRCGRHFRVVAYSVPSPLFRQYDLVIDGESFFDFPHRDDFVGNTEAVPDKESVDSSYWRKKEQRSRHKRTASGPATVHRQVDADFNPRDRNFIPRRTIAFSSLAGDEELIASNPSSSPFQICEDGHETDEYSFEPSLPPLCRGSQTTRSLGCDGDGTAESRFAQEDYLDNVDITLVDSEREGNESFDIVRKLSDSDAISMAFCDNENIRKCSLSTDELTVEANALCDAYDFMKWIRNEDESRNLSDRISFLQRQLSNMVNNVRHGILSSEAGARIFHRIQEVAGFAVQATLPRDTVLVFGLPEQVCEADLFGVMKEFGAVKGISLASRDRGLGLCRFEDGSSADRAITASSKAMIRVLGLRVQVRPIQSALFSDEQQAPALTETTDDEESSQLREIMESPPQTPKLAKISPPNPTTGSVSTPRHRPVEFLRKIFKSPVPSEEWKKMFKKKAAKHDIPLIPLLDHDEGANEMSFYSETQSRLIRVMNIPEEFSDDADCNCERLVLRPFSEEHAERGFDLYRDVLLEEMRTKISAVVKGCEDMLSQALTTALTKSIASRQDKENSCHLCGIKKEANMIQCIFNRYRRATSRSYQERLALFQLELNTLATSVKDRTLNPEAASRVAFFCAELLEIRRSKDFPVTALVVIDPGASTNHTHILHAIESLGIANSYTADGFGLFIFKSPVSANQVLEAMGNTLSTNSNTSRHVLIRSGCTHDIFVGHESKTMDGRTKKILRARNEASKCTCKNWNKSKVHLCLPRLRGESDAISDRCPAESHSNREASSLRVAPAIDVRATSDASPITKSSKTAFSGLGSKMSRRALLMN